MAAGDLAAARDYYEQGLAISRTLADADPASAQKQRDLSVSFNNLMNISKAAGDLAAVRAYLRQIVLISPLVPVADAGVTSAQNQLTLLIPPGKLA